MAGWGKIAGALIGPAIGVGTKLYEQNRSTEAIKELFLRRLVADNGLVAGENLGVPVTVSGLTLTITHLPPVERWPYRYHIEVMAVEERGDSPTRVRAFHYYRDDNGKSRFGKS